MKFNMPEFFLATKDMVKVIEQWKLPSDFPPGTKKPPGHRGNTGGGDFEQTFEWSERTLPYGSQLPNWPSYLDEIDVQ
mgnify:CR=1 FL=1